MEKVIAIYLCAICAQEEKARKDPVADIPNGALAKYIERDRKYVSMILSRLKEKHVILKSKSKQGRSGSTRYYLNPLIFHSYHS